MIFVTSVSAGDIPGLFFLYFEARRISGYVAIKILNNFGKLGVANIKAL